jgi:hypothetical protein
MVPEDLLFWIAPLGAAPTADPNVLCRRHADAMVVPRGWTLDDRREAQPRLFKPRSSMSGDAVAAVPARRRRHRHDDLDGEQLQIDGTGEIGRPSPSLLAAVDDDLVGDGDDDLTLVAGEPTVAPWQPDFDARDDLGGLLEVTSPLLARAFRGTDRPRG